MASLQMGSHHSGRSTLTKKGCATCHIPAAVRSVVRAGTKEHHRTHVCGCVDGLWGSTGDTGQEGWHAQQGGVGSHSTVAWVARLATTVWWLRNHLHVPAGATAVVNRSARRSVSGVSDARDAYGGMELQERFVKRKVQRCQAESATVAKIADARMHARQA